MKEGHYHPRQPAKRRRRGVTSITCSKSLKSSGFIYRCVLLSRNTLTNIWSHYTEIVRDLFSNIEPVRFFVCLFCFVLPPSPFKEPLICFCGPLPANHTTSHSCCENHRDHKTCFPFSHHQFTLPLCQNITNETEFHEKNCLGWDHGNNWSCDEAWPLLLNYLIISIFILTSIWNQIPYLTHMSAISSKGS